jgi:hypothetical protein
MYSRNVSNGAVGTISVDCEAVPVRCDAALAVPAKILSADTAASPVARNSRRETPMLGKLLDPVFDTL